MKSKKPIIITAVVMFVMTTAFYLTPLGTNLNMFLKTLSGDVSVNTKMERMSMLMDKYYLNEYDSSAMEESALSAYTVPIKDPYTTYITKEMYASFIENMGGDYQGIGVEVTADENGITVTSVFENSPAQKAGLQIDDVIVAVEGKKCDISNYKEAINTIKGVDAKKNDDDVVITVKRGEKEFDMTLVRETVSVDTVNSKVFNTNIGYIQITDFGEHTYKEFSSHLNTLKNKGITSLVIDLRNNPGGALNTVVDVADDIVGEGKILTIKNKAGKESVYNSDEKQLTIPICVLINENSASASEVLAGAIRDHKKGTLIGKKTYGKGVVQSLVEFGDGSAFKLTTAKYYTPSGECIDGVGIKPDIEIELSENAKNKPIKNLNIDEDKQLAKAIEVLR